MKPSVPTYTVSDQPGESLQILVKKALDTKVNIFNDLNLSISLKKIKKILAIFSALFMLYLHWMNTSGVLTR